MGPQKNDLRTHDLILEACSRILRREGLTNLTLKAVAEEAGISKGGLLYHFPNKVALIETLFKYHNDKFESRLQELAEIEGDVPGAWLRAYARASIEQIADPDNASLYASLFAAEDSYASAHKLMRQKYTLWQKQVEECGLDPDWATLVRFAVDGLWFSEMHRYAPPSSTRHDKIVNLILELIDNPKAAKS